MTTMDVVVLDFMTVSVEVVGLKRLWSLPYLAESCGAMEGQRDHDLAEQGNEKSPLNPFGLRGLGVAVSYGVALRY